MSHLFYLYTYHSMLAALCKVRSTKVLTSTAAVLADKVAQSEQLHSKPNP